MRQRSRTLTFGITAVALLAVFVLVLQQRPQSEAAVVAKPVATHTTASIDTAKIVPADVLGTGVVNWAPLTGDGSN
jgi:hypothetical protein